MKIYEILNEDGRIVKGVNTTVDVGPNEIKTQAAKFGNTVDKDGVPPTLSKRVKGKSTNVLFNLGLTESTHYATIEEALGEIASATEIYVDMDGVLADFFGEWAKLMNVDHFTDINKQHDINDALQKIRDTDDFWLRLPVLPQAKELLNLIKQVKGEYYICTSPLADDPNSERHKRTWVEENLAFFPPKEVYVTHNKPQYAKHEDGTPNILIDDYGVNINNWEAAGGIGFKYKDHKFERTAKAIKQHMQEPVEENFADGKNQIKEALDNPYPVRWLIKDDDEWEGKAKTEADDSIQIMITQGHNNHKWEIDFYVGGSMQVTGKGDQFRVFATVVSAVKEWWSWLSKSKQPVEAIIFSAFKGNEDTKGSAGRSNLYRRFADQFARSIGFEVSTVDGSDNIKFMLTNPNYKDQQTENFADGKKKGKSRPGRVKRSGASCNGSVTSLRKRAKNASGEKAKMYHWCANMKSGKRNEN